MEDRPLVVSAFGSLGAKVMNETMAGLFALEQASGFPYYHIHATGSFGWEWMPDLVKEKGVDLETARFIDMREYIYNMPTVMCGADVIISRAGASTCNEICASGTPSILIPSPNVTANHQEKNARVLSDRDAAVLVLEKDCSPRELFEQIMGLLANERRRSDMEKTLRSMARMDSTERICDIVDELTKN
jgi:UDP-N-acetylglucosamine--N-acetylmuramyl-(pentapeptide) pyrophosphoryl-undecaprenol N-acetylglucosamine transferase